MSTSQNRQTLFAIDKITKVDELKNFRFKIIKRRCLWTKEVNYSITNLGR